MKRAGISAYLITLIIGLVFTSCSKNEKQEKEVMRTKSELIKELTAFNEQMMLLKPPTRLPSKELILVVTADLTGAYRGGQTGLKIGAKIGALTGNPITGGAFGAFIGGVGYGAFCSWAAYPLAISDDTISIDYTMIANAYNKNCGSDNFLEILDVISDETKKQIILEPAISAQVALGDADLLIGLNHNIMLATLQGAIENNSHITETKISSSELSLEEQILFSTEMEDTFNELFKEFDKDKISNTTDLPDQIVQLYTELISNYVEECSDMVFIVNKYLECIDNSNEISKEDKTNLKIGLATSLYSYNYWSNSDIIWQ